ncbi:uncharacterized protein LOC143285382 [Babylonia areolata]|uniref:uncharacterized protein LOC143285382 n=1 Tax=Babylonia areolata TaxID=304850 RepID=UPI003FD1A66A
MSFSISTIGLDMGSENVTLSDPRCHVHRSEHKLLGRTPLNACGTSVRFTNDTIIFSNFLIIPPKDNDNENDDDDDSDNTTSVSNIERVIPIECHYNRVSELRLSYLPLMRHILFTETGVGAVPVPD